MTSFNSKYPPAVPLHSAALLPDTASTTTVHSVIFDALDGPVIRAAALRTSGAAGPLSLMLMVGEDRALCFVLLQMNYVLP